jgi:hypothetical protein
MISSTSKITENNNSSINSAMISNLFQKSMRSEETFIHLADSAFGK